MSFSKQVIKDLRPVGSGDYGTAGTFGPDWLVCDGSFKAISDYPELAAFLTTRYASGVVPVGQFQLPNAMDKVLIGLDTYGTARGSANQNLGIAGTVNNGASLVTWNGQGGVASVASLTYQQFPYHKHTTGETAHSHPASTSHSHPGHTRATGGIVYPKAVSGGTTRLFISTTADSGYSGTPGYVSIADTVNSNYNSYEPVGFTLGKYTGGASHPNEQPHTQMLVYIKAR